MTVHTPESGSATSLPNAGDGKGKAGGGSKSYTTPQHKGNTSTRVDWMIKVKVCASIGVVTFVDRCRWCKETEIRLVDSELINSRPAGELDILQNKIKYQPETFHKDWKTTCRGWGGQGGGKGGR